jgi:hypothetical protein
MKSKNYLFLMVFFYFITSPIFSQDICSMTCSYNGPTTVVKGSTLTGTISGYVNCSYKWTQCCLDGGSYQTFTLSSGPSGMSVNQNGTITWTPSSSQGGTHSISVVMKEFMDCTSCDNGSIVQYGEGTCTFTIEVPTGNLNVHVEKYGPGTSSDSQSSFVPSGVTVNYSCNIILGVGSTGYVSAYANCLPVDSITYTLTPGGDDDEVTYSRSGSFVSSGQTITAEGYSYVSSNSPSGAYAIANAYMGW